MLKILPLEWYERHKGSNRSIETFLFPIKLNQIWRESARLGRHSDTKSRGEKQDSCDSRSRFGVLRESRESLRSLLGFSKVVRESRKSLRSLSGVSGVFQESRESFESLGSPSGVF